MTAVAPDDVVELQPVTTREVAARLHDAADRSDCTGWVFSGPSSVFTSVLDPRAGFERKDAFRPTRVAQGATIGANATIVRGHTIGPCSLVAGVPTRRVSRVSHAGERLGPDLVCPRTGQRYREHPADQLVELFEGAAFARHE